MQKIKKDDEVIVITGRDKGRRGKVIRISRCGGRVFVSGINMVKKHQKPNPRSGVSGGIIEKEASIHRSNVAIFEPRSGKASRVGFNTLADGRKVRIFKINKEQIDI